MPRYLISFDYGVMDVPESELPAVSEAAHAVVREAEAAGVLVFAGGVVDPSLTRVVSGDGRVAIGPLAGKDRHIGGLTIVEVATEAEAMAWAARIATACRCEQEVREFGAGSMARGD